MNKTLVVLGILFLVTLASARPPSQLLDKYDQTTCWSNYASDMVDYVDVEYGGVPSYLQAYADQLDSAMSDLFDYAVADDRADFMGKLSEVMNLVRKIQGSFWRESIHAIIYDRYPVGDIANDFGGMTDVLNSCLNPV